LDLNHRLGLLEAGLQPRHLALKLRHLILERVTLLRFATGRERGELGQAAAGALFAPFRDMRGVGAHPP
jgi:hypothetical protein